MCNYKKLLILIAAATLFLSGCGNSNNNSPAAPGLTHPAGITVAAIDDNNPATAPAVFAVPAAINDSNQIVGSAEAEAGGVLKPTFWLVDNEGAASVAPTEMATVVDGFAAAHDINAGGVIVGNAANIDTSLRAVVWGDKDAAPVLLNSLAGGFFAAAYGINDAGKIVGTSENIDGLLQAVRWQRDTVTGTLTGPSVLPGVPAGWEAEANAVNADDHIAGELVDVAGISHAVVWHWDGVSYTPLNLTLPAGFEHAVALDLNSPAAGQPLLVVGEVSDDGLSGLTHAVRWSIDAGNNITVIDLGTTDRSSSASAVNNAGRAAGWENNAAAVSLATLWNNPTGKGALLTISSQAFDINNNNLVVGRSDSQGFVKVAN